MLWWHCRTVHLSLHSLMIFTNQQLSSAVIIRSNVKVPFKAALWYNWWNFQPRLQDPKSVTSYQSLLVAISAVTGASLLLSEYSCMLLSKPMKNLYKETLFSVSEVMVYERIAPHFTFLACFISFSSHWGMPREVILSLLWFW